MDHESLSHQVCARLHVELVGIDDRYTLSQTLLSHPLEILIPRKCLHIISSNRQFRQVAVQCQMTIGTRIGRQRSSNHLIDRSRKVSIIILGHLQHVHMACQHHADTSISQTVTNGLVVLY